MGSLLTVSVLVLLVAVLMTMVGKGGGNFYVVILALAGIPMHQAATTGQFILFAGATAAMLVFHQNKMVSWPLAILAGGVMGLSALAGGYASHLFSGVVLKVIFAGLLLASGLALFLPKQSGRSTTTGRRTPGIVHLTSRGETYAVHLPITLPIMMAAGFGSGMVGVSGGSFLVPLLVLACGVPMQIAVGTASTVVAATALMGFAGHAAQGDFHLEWALPLAACAIAGGLLGGRLALKSKPVHLKWLFAATNGLAALAMIWNAVQTKGMP